MRMSGEKRPYAGVRNSVGMDLKVQQFLRCFKTNAFRIKISPEKHVSKLLQIVLVCPSLIPSSSSSAAISLPLYNI